MAANTFWIWIVIGIVVGLLLLGISSAILRSLREEQTHLPPAEHWTQLVDESLGQADVQLRLDIVERLEIVNSPWSREILARASKQERDPGVRAAIENALGR